MRNTAVFSCGRCGTAAAARAGSTGCGGAIGRRVSCVIDRPLGSTHPDFPEMIYPVNYGYAEGVTGGDGEPQDVYVLGEDRPLRTFSGTVIAVLHRLNDREDKWIVTADGRPLPPEQIRAAIAFQEQYFMGELITDGAGQG